VLSLLSLSSSSSSRLAGCSSSLLAGRIIGGGCFHAAFLSQEEDYDDVDVFPHCSLPQPGAQCPCPQAENLNCINLQKTGCVARNKDASPQMGGREIEKIGERAKQEKEQSYYVGWLLASTCPATLPQVDTSSSTGCASVDRRSRDSKDS